MRIDQPGNTAASAGPARKRGTHPNFAIPPEQAAPAEAEQAQTTAPTQPPALPSRAATGEFVPDAADDRAAAAHGDSVLNAMAGLQHALLQGDTTDAGHALAALARTIPRAADPRLNAVLDSVALRAAVELARSK